MVYIPRAWDFPTILVTDGTITALRRSNALVKNCNGYVPSVANCRELPVANCLSRIACRELPVMSSLGVEEGTKQFNKRMDSVTWIGAALEPLEQKMAPYLDFHKL